MKSKKKNSNRNHREYKPFDMFQRNARLKKYRKEMKGEKK